MAAQTVAGPWVDVAEQRIEEHRKTELRVIVLDAQQRVAEGASVRIEQLRHDFPLGVVLHGPSIPGFDPEGPVYRCFNAVSLKKLTAWPNLQPSGPGEFEFRSVETAVSWAEVFGLSVHWGGVVSADPAFQPEWAVLLDADARLRAAARLVDVIGFTFDGRIDSATLYTHGLDQPWLGEPALRWLFNHAKTTKADLDLRLGYEQALTGDRGRRMLVDADGKRMSFVRADGVSITHEFSDRFARDPLDRVLQRLGRLDLPTIVDGLEVGGESALDAPQNLEAALITLFGEPSVEAIFFTGLTADVLRDPNAAFVDETGRATSCGLVLERLFRQRWWTDRTVEADELGNVRLRVFAGHYRVTATLRDGTVLQTEVLAPKADEERVVVLEPVWEQSTAVSGVETE